MSAIVQSKAIDLAQSQSFYEKLNFQVLHRGATSLVSDGTIIMELNPDPYARNGVKLYRESWEEVLAHLAPNHQLIPIEGGHLLSDPSGCRIYLMNGAAPVPVQVDSNVTSLLGKCAGFSLETTEMARSIAFWNALGFKQTMGGVEQGWVSLSNEASFNVSIMKALACPHVFFNPSLTYFNGKENLDIIAKIRATGIPIAEEVTVFNKEGIVDNIIIRDPGGFGFFIFSD